MKSLLAIVGAVMLFGGMGFSQAAGTINSLSVNPRQNQELTNSTGTESGQPNDAVPGSQSEPNGLIPSTNDMVGPGGTADAQQSAPASKPAASANTSSGKAQSTTTRKAGSSTSTSPK